MHLRYTERFHPQITTTTAAAADDDNNNNSAGDLIEICEHITKEQGLLRQKKDLRLLVRLRYSERFHPQITTTTADADAAADDDNDNNSAGDPIEICEHITKEQSLLRQKKDLLLLVSLRYSEIFHPQITTTTTAAADDDDNNNSAGDPIEICEQITKEQGLLRQKRTY